MSKLICEDCKEEYKPHDFTYPEKCVFCSDIAMMNDMDEELDYFGE